MLRVAIVEDSLRDAEQLTSCLQRFSRKHGSEIEIQRYENALLFLQGYKGNFDIIFMDIDMPMMSGMEAAHSLRQVDPHVLLIFVTALARFALNGYEVDAYDFIVKPVQENFFEAKMNRALKKLSSEQRTRLLIKSGDKSVRISGHHEGSDGDSGYQPLCHVQQVLCGKHAAHPDDQRG